MSRNIVDPKTPSFGTWCQIGHPANAEIMAKAGFDWITADCEHGEFEDGHIANFCRAVRQAPCTPLIRVKENAVLPIRRALDLGAAGVIVPLVNTADDAERAVAAAHYPPNGIRGFAWHGGNDWGRTFDAYVKDFKPLVIVMIESKTAVENIDAIMAVQGVDASFIGPYDMSGSFGVIGQTRHPLIREATLKIAAACKKHGKATGMHILEATRDDVKTAVDQGMTFIALGMDSYFLGNGARQILSLGK